MFLSTLQLRTLLVHRHLHVKYGPHKMTHRKILPNSWNHIQIPLLHYIKVLGLCFGMVFYLISLLFQADSHYLPRMCIPHSTNKAKYPR